MRSTIYFAIAFLLFCFSAKAQNSFSFKSGIKNSPEGLVHPETYLFLGDEWTSIINTNAVIPQFDLGFTLKDPGSQWALYFGLNYRHIETKSTVYYDIQSGPGGYSTPPFNVDYVTSLNYFGVSLGAAYFIPSKNRNSQLSIPFGVQMLLPFSCTATQELGQDTYLSSEIFQGQNFSDGIYLGLYLRPTYSFKLSKKSNSPWRFGIFAEAELLHLNQPNHDPSFLGGGGFEIRYLLN
ncbi:hypothetical protein [Owenweeksia hongkongensis]|uniref:hypothetical protein n=1 Tax=Owenweeksia hongkongensis TaxID=253245 RepID=UPI0003008FB5|nr:hypothetical protein [Owenweeksia hongkongensis]